MTLGFQFLEANQSQKEITINEAFYRSQALLQGGVLSNTQQTPPVSPSVGDSYIVPTGSTGVWATRIGNIAYYTPGGWRYIIPTLGIQMRVAGNDGVHLVYDGTGWISNAYFARGSFGLWQPAHSKGKITLSSSTTNVANLIPDRALVLCLTLRVTQAITGATAFGIGYTGSTIAFGSGIGVALNTTNIGLLGNPQGFFENTNVVVTAQGGNFTGGQISYVLYYHMFAPPDVVETL